MTCGTNASCHRWLPWGMGAAARHVRGHVLSLFNPAGASFLLLQTPFLIPLAHPFRCSKPSTVLPPRFTGL